MTTRRARGEGGLHWDESRQRWIATITVGYTPAGKRIVRKGSGKTKTEARAKLREKIRDYEDGLALVQDGHTVADALTDWLTYGLSNQSESTKANYTTLVRSHIISDLGARKLRDLSATDVDRWLMGKAQRLSTRTLRLLHSLLNRAINRAMARDRVKRNVVALCEVPTGRGGRPSKSLTLDHAKALLIAAESSSLHAYIVVSLLTGARTEELRALTWSHVDLAGKPDNDPPVPPSIQVWRSVRADGDTKTKKSRRTLALPARCVTALTTQHERQGQPAADRLVFASTAGTALDPAQRASGLPPRRRQSGPRPARLDSPRTAAQLRVPTVGQRHEPRTDRGPLRPLRHDGHRNRLSAPTTAGAPGRCSRHGPDLRR